MKKLAQEKQITQPQSSVKQAPPENSKQQQPSA